MALINLNDEMEENIVSEGIWNLLKNTNEYAGYIELRLKSKYYRVKELTLEEYKEIKLAEALKENYEGTDIIVNTVDDEMLSYSYDRKLLPSIEDYICAYEPGFNREEAIEDYLGGNIDTLLTWYGYTREDIPVIEAEYENEYLPSIKEYNDISNRIRNNTYTITYPDGTQEEVLGENLYKFEKRYVVKENGNNDIIITENNKKTIKLTTKVDNLITRIDDEYYKYIPVRGGYNAIVLDKTLTTYPVPATEMNGVPIVGYMMTYYNCKNMTDINFEGADTSKVRIMCGMFEMCLNVSNLNLKGIDTSNVTNMKGMFWRIEKISSLDLSSFNTSNVTDMRQMFYGSNGILSLDLSNFDTSNVTDMSWMFSGCQKITNLDLSNFDTSKVNNMSWMFALCKNLERITGGEKWIIGDNVNIEYMFYGCKTEEVL